jgi:hypothetical protein
MVTPTDAQEVAAKAIFDYFVRNSREAATWENARLFYMQAAKFALTAAAEVGKRMPTYEQIAQQNTNLRNDMEGATGIIGGYEKENQRLKIELAATIERCAQYHDEQEKLFRMRARQYLDEPGALPECHDAQDQVADWHKNAAAAIRALKDKA